MSYDSAPRHSHRRSPGAQPPGWSQDSHRGSYAPAPWETAPDAPAPRRAYDDYNAPATRESWAPVAPTPPRRPFAPRMTPAGSFWYVLQCIAFGAGYFAKVPAKKALQDAGLGQMTSAEQFWYVLGCIPFGAFYFAKLPMAKALTEVAGRP
jgi:hypothetical protein